MNNKEEKVHIHKVVQMHNCTYDWVYQKFGIYIDENRMIPRSVLEGINY